MSGLVFADFMSLMLQFVANFIATHYLRDPGLVSVYLALIQHLRLADGTWVAQSFYGV